MERPYLLRGQTLGPQDPVARQRSLLVTLGHCSWWSNPAGDARLLGKCPNPKLQAGQALGEAVGEAQRPWERPYPLVMASLVQAALSPHKKAPKPAICCVAFRSQFCHLLAVWP